MGDNLHFVVIYVIKIIGVIMVTIYHNPRCSKSRATLGLLEENDCEINIVKYLDTPPAADVLYKALAGFGREKLLRSGEEAYKELVSGKDLTDAELVEVMIANPIIIERPLVVSGSKLALGRPPESVLDII